jgi:diadenosine tetraphosphate (Ap4A) HIT family hydrolase
VYPLKVEEKRKKRSFFDCEGDASSVSFHLRAHTSHILKARTFTTAWVVDAFPQTNPHTQIHVLPRYQHPHTVHFVCCRGWVVRVGGGHSIGGVGLRQVWYAP